MSGSLAGKVALVTGASSGIGEATAVALAQAGATVVISARRKARLDALAARIAAAGGVALGVVGDVAEEAAATAAVEETVKAFGRIDILVNSAGIIESGGIETADLDTYRRVIDVNLLGTVYTSQAAVRHMKAQGGGDIINVTSLAGRKTGPVFNAYHASKYAANAMTDSMRQELGGFGIRVAILMPGATKTEVGDNMSDPNFRKMMQDHVSKEGAVLPSEVADTMVFMLSLPRRVNISEISIRPTIDTTA